MKMPNFSYFAVCVVDLRNPDSKIIIDKVTSFTLIREIKEKLAFQLNCTINQIKLFHPNNPHSSRSVDLKESQALHDLGIDKGGGTIQMSKVYDSAHTVRRSLLSSQSTELISPISVGTSGVYIYGNSVFKPYDEEQGDKLALPLRCMIT